MIAIAVPQKKAALGLTRSQSVPAMKLAGSAVIPMIAQQSPYAVHVRCDGTISDIIAFWEPSVRALQSQQSINKRMNTQILLKNQNQKYIPEKRRNQRSINLSFPIESERVPSGIANNTDTVLKSIYMRGTYILSTPVSVVRTIRSASVEFPSVKIKIIPRKK